MIVDFWRGPFHTGVYYDTEQDILFTGVRGEYGGPSPEYWRPHPEHPGLLVGYVLSERDLEEDEDGKLVRPDPFDDAVALKLTRASLEGRWSPWRSTELHAMNALVYAGYPDMGLVHTMAHALASLDEWLDARQLKFEF
jgi:hypothetical protein